MDSFEIVFYSTADGYTPVVEFLDNLDQDMAVKVAHNIRLLSIKGTSARAPLSKPLGDGIFEIRTISSGNITRVLYFFVVGRRIVLTNGFTKKTPKTPRSEIELARKYRSDYIRRMEASE